MSAQAALALKAFHVLMACVFLGGGSLIAWFKIRAERSGDPRIVAWGLAEVVRADWVFTLPGALLLLGSGLGLAHAHGRPIVGTSWILAALVDYTVAGLLWIPAVHLQLRMRDLATRAADRGDPDLPPEYHRASRIWLALGVPAFLVSLHAVYAMTAKRVVPW